MQSVNELNRSARSASSYQKIQQIAANVKAISLVDALKVGSIWTESSKTDKSVDVGHVDQAFVCYLIPGITCSNWTEKCLASCFGDSVTGTYTLKSKASQMAMARRTALALYYSAEFTQRAVSDLLSKIKPGTRIVSVRLNGTSDYTFGGVRFAIRQALRNVGVDCVFYEYTKNWNLVHNSEPYFTDDSGTKSVQVFFSLSAHEHVSTEAIKLALSKGINVAVPILVPKSKTYQKPLWWKGFPSIDGDKHDYLPAHPKGVIILLGYKNQSKTAAQSATGFIQPVESGV